jgi:hypothetical protein
MEWVKRSDDVIGKTNVDPPGGVPIRPLCSRLLDQIDVLALRILLCAEEDHCELWVCTFVLRGKACGQMSYMWNNQPIDVQRFLWRLTLSELATQPRCCEIVRSTQCDDKVIPNNLPVFKVRKCTTQVSWVLSETGGANAMRPTWNPRTATALNGVL